MFSAVGRVCSKLAESTFRFRIVPTLSQRHLFPLQKRYYNGLTQNETSERLKIDLASRDDLRIMTEWAVGEQWNPGLNDFECYYATDPNGIWMAQLDGKPAACVFVVTYDSSFGFAGLLITRPDLRGSGVGFAVFRKAVEACKATTIGAYGLVDLEEYYRKPGYDLVMIDRNVRYGGVPSFDTGRQSAIHDGIVPINPENLDAVYSYDREIFPVQRTSFLSAWLSAPQHIGHAAVEKRQVTGYGVIRPCHGKVNRIGPLFADDAETAERLFHALVYSRQRRQGTCHYRRTRAERKCSQALFAVRARAQDALLLLRNSFAIPKALYILRTAPCFLSEQLEVFDGALRSILSQVLNIDLDQDMAWLQASLPVRAGGLGVRRAAQLAPSAYLASAAGCSALIQQIVPPSVRALPDANVESAISVWSQHHSQPPPPSPDSTRQRVWDAPHIEATYNVWLEQASDHQAKARLMAVSCPESGAWLHAFPIAALGLRMSDDVVRVAAGLRILFILLLYNKFRKIIKIVFVIIILHYIYIITN